MTFLTLQPLSVDLLPAALALDQRCFGGLWTLDGYRRELESPNSELLVLVEEVGGRLRRERSAERGQEAEGAEEAREARETREAREARETTQNSYPTPDSRLPTPLIGLGCYWAILEEAHITMLAIDPAYQRQGLGQALLYALLASAHYRRLERTTLEVRPSNVAALALYQKFDFCEAGRRRRYYPDNDEDALVLWRGGLQAPEFPASLTTWQQQAVDRLQRAGWQLHARHDCASFNVSRAWSH